MEKITFDAATGGGNKIAAFFCPTDVKTEDGRSKGVIQICHGMADYFGRYEEMVGYLNRAGFDVCGMDMMGHGQTYGLNKGNDMPLGYFGDSKDSAMCILKDEMTLHGKAKERFGEDVPYILYGHSMGSFVARNLYITPEYSREFDAFIFASTMGPNPAAGAGLFLSKLMKVFGLKRKPGKMIDKIAFGTYNKRIDNPKTNYDWVTSDEKEVEKYCKDELAGFLFTNKGFTDLFTLVTRMQKKDAYDAIDPGKPALLTYGEDDPVAGYGEGAHQVCEILRAKGVKVTEKNYGHFRHEIQNESVREQYFNDIIEFAGRAEKK
ncbi:MAG: alpha/beta hydrolase [Clostridiales bacterium]|nr:alpha/beta hydrolase [Clostridiales bacterium]